MKDVSITESGQKENTNFDWLVLKPPILYLVVNM